MEIPTLESPRLTDGGSETETSVRIDWVSPETNSYTNSHVLIRVDVAGSKPERLELLVDGVVVAPLSASSELQFETWTLSEGPHAFTVRAILGTHTFVSSERSINVDRTRPKIIDQTPLSGAFQVLVDAAIQATFSEPLRRESVSGQSIHLQMDSGDLAADIVLSEDGKVLTLVPGTPLPVGKLFSVVIDPAVTDLAGNPLDSLSQKWSWHVPSYLLLGEPLFYGKFENSGVFASSIRVGRDSRPIVAWMQHGLVHVRGWTGEHWDSLGGPLNGDPSGVAWTSVLDIDSEGRPLVAWIETELDNSNRLYVRRWTGLTWESMGSFLVPTLNQGRMNWLQVNATIGQAPVVAWIEDSSTQYQMVFRQWNGTGWESRIAPLPLQKERRLFSYDYTSFELDAMGKPVVVYSEWQSSAYVGRVWRWSGGAWEDISPNTKDVVWVHAIDASGDVLVGVRTLVGGVWRTMVKKYVGGGWLSLGEPLESIPGGNDEIPVESIALDSQGRPVVFISELLSDSDPLSRVGQAWRWNGSRWEAIGGVLTALPGKFIHGRPSFALTADDVPIVAWTEQFYPAESHVFSAIHVFRPND
ncbi:Ig-like domain-containing protein [Corallococcus sp. EGB]|uniref:Ig-like domain-containing protein n=1 Tax=Corallococcus sp. EGB TaxID=1521117 RepID=UPI001CBCD160|nr:Ig-like domain-containing protein [Corallococcus sp. EGB]